jgi:Tol biopolymer transport system component
LVDGHWTAPEVAPFSGQYLDIEPAISPDGSKFFFASNRPRPGTDALTADPDIWVMDRSGDGWSAPRNLGPPINTDRPEYFPSITADGTIYFTGTDEDGSEWIYRSRATADGYAPRERLGPEVNAGSARFNAFVAPDESYVIVPVMGREDSVGGVDYYVVFRTPDDRFSEPINLGVAINTPNSEWSASISPGGEVLFFMSSRSVIVDHRAPARMDHAAMWRLHEVAMNGNSDIWWVDASVISDLRPEGF